MTGTPPEASSPENDACGSGAGTIKARFSSWEVASFGTIFPISIWIIAHRSIWIGLIIMNQTKIKRGLPKVNIKNNNCIDGEFFPRPRRI
jgi:hypothetical protein